MTPTPGELPAAAPSTREALPVRRRQPPRDVVRAYSCPRCGAFAGSPCEGRRGARKSHHLERVERAVELRYGQRLELPRTGAITRPAAAVSRGAVSLDSDATGATLGAALGR